MMGAMGDVRWPETTKAKGSGLFSAGGCIRFSTASAMPAALRVHWLMRCTKNSVGNPLP